MLEDIISIAEIEQERSPVEFVAWFDTLLARINGTRDFRAQVLRRQGIAKPIFEELFPLYRLLGQKTEAWHDRRFRNVIGSQGYDVVVGSLGGPSHIEITVADADRAEAVRMEVFIERGSVPALSPVKWSGTKRTGRIVEISEDAQLHSEIVRKKQQQILEAIQRKSRGSYEGPTALLVYFDDYVAFADPDDLALMLATLDAGRPAWTSRFSALYIVGASGKCFWEESADPA